MTSRHAYLILAHGQWEVLRLLLSSIDDERNDIFVHLDAKVAERPEVSVKRSRLYWLEDREDVRWGDVSMVRAELKLFAYASAQGQYAYYHLLSGVDLPIKSQDYIHAFCAQHEGKQFVGYYHGEDLEASLDRRLRRWHLFPKSFRGASLPKRIVRALCLRIQELVGYRRNRSVHFCKGTQWVSITDELVRRLVRDGADILRLYEHTFCSDEIFLQTYLASSDLASTIFDANDEAHGCMRLIGWRDGVLYDFVSSDLEQIKQSSALFARKFNEQDMQLLARVVDYSDTPHLPPR